MKKLISLLLTLAMLVSVCAVFSSVTPVGAAVAAVGDVNSDGKINSMDVLVLKKVIAGKLDGGYGVGADVNGDGAKSAADVMAIKLYISGYDNVFTASKPVTTVKNVKIGENDISKYEMVITEPPAEYRCADNYHYGSRIFRNYINEATGYFLAFTKTPTEGKKHIFYTCDTTGTLGKEGYTLKVESNGDLYITGGHRRGCAYAAYDILKKYIGWRFFESDSEYCYPSECAVIPGDLNVTHIPALGYRDVHWDPWIDEGYDSIGLLCCAEHINSHTDRPVMESPKYGAFGEGNTWANAHSFDLIMNVPYDRQPCLTDTSNYSKASGFWINELTKRATNDANTYIGFNLSRVSVSWNDNENFCFCSNCDAIYREEQSIAGTLVRFNNVVSEMIAAVYPEVETYYIAYGSARVPPKVTTPNSHCVICYCWNGCNNHTFDSNECSDVGNALGYTNWEERYYFEAWSRITTKLFAWYYITNFNWVVSPCPNVMNIKADIRYLADHGVDGMYCEFESSATESFEGLKAYLAAECMWNPQITDTEYEALIKDYLSYKYGPGWQYIRQYIDIATEAGNRKGCFTNNYDWIGSMYDFDYMYSQFDTIVSLFNSAYNAASNSTQKAKVEKLSIHAYFIALCGAYNGHAYDANVRERYQKLYNMVKSYGYRIVSSAIGVPGPSTEFDASPAYRWLDLPYDATWETYYRTEGRTMPRDTPGCSGRLSRPYMSSLPTKSYNPYENIGR